MIAPAVVAPAIVAPACASSRRATLLAHWFPPDLDGRENRWYYKMFLKLRMAFLD